MNFIESLNNTIKHWMKDNKDEWLFVKFRETEIDILDSSSAFSLIDKTIPVLLNENNRDIWNELFETIFALVRKSNTTEVPKSISDNWDTLKKLSHQDSSYAQGKFEELATYYRIDLQ